MVKRWETKGGSKWSVFKMEIISGVPWKFVVLNIFLNDLF